MKFPGQFIENELPEGESLPATHSWTTKYTDGTNRYAIKLERLDSAAPTLSINLKNVITITDFSNNKEYAYSTDGGNTWTAVTSATFTATEVNKEYLVKVARNNAYNESEATAITSNPFAVIGTSLVLDGQIGVKAYFNIDTDVVDVNMVTIYNTKKDSDYVDDGTGTGGFREYGAAIKTTSAAKWSTRLLYDEALDLYYVIFFVPAKDADNVHFENELHYYLKPTEDGADPIQVKFGNIGTNFNASAYIEEAKALVEAGDEKFVAAADLINATENYVAYADAYLNGKTIDAYASTETITAEAATRTDTTLDGVEFYGTSLILEDNVTIRHYFKVNDMDAFIAAGYICDVEYGVKDDYIYYDITDIPAQELGTQYALNIKASTGSIIYTVNYSATNYMAEMAKNSDSTLVSLVNAMYDYYLAAEDYAK